MNKIAIMCSPLLLAACGGGTDEAASGTVEGATSAIITAATVNPTVTTREGAEQVYTCRGLTSAATAAKMALPANQIPTELAALSTSDASYWNKQMAAIAPGVLSADDEASLIASSTRVFATRMALEEEKAAILQCLAAIPKS